MRYHVTEQLGPHQFLTDEGVLIVRDVPLARTGMQLYAEHEVPIKGDGRGQVVIDRDPEEVFSEPTIASINGKYVTLDHPYEDVTPENWKRYAVGHVMYPHRGEGINDHLLYGDLFIADPEAIRAIRNGKLREVSVGYDAGYEQTADGRGRQYNIRCNHLAIVDSGRCGPVCRINDHATLCTCGDAEQRRDEVPARARLLTRDRRPRHRHIYIHA